MGRNGPCGREAEPGRVGRSGGVERRGGPGVRSGVEEVGGAVGPTGVCGGAAAGPEVAGRSAGGVAELGRRSPWPERAWTSGAGQTGGPVCWGEPSGGGRGGSKAGTDADRTSVEVSAVVEFSTSTSGLCPPRRLESRRNSEGRSGPASAGDGSPVAGDPAGRSAPPGPEGAVRRATWSGAGPSVERSSGVGEDAGEPGRAVGRGLPESALSGVDSEVLDLGPPGIWGSGPGWSPDGGSAERRGTAPRPRPSDLGSSPRLPGGRSWVAGPRWAPAAGAADGPAAPVGSPVRAPGRASPGPGPGPGESGGMAVAGP